MVAVETRSTRPSAITTGVRGGRGWMLAAGAVLVVGPSLRLLLAGAGVGDRSAVVMALLLSIGAWLVGLLVSTPRVAFLAALAVVALLDVAGLPVPNAPEYDFRQAFFRADQVVATRASNPPQLDLARAQPLLMLLVEPVFPSGAAQPAFGLAGEVGASGSLAWECAFRRGLQHLALPVPTAALVGAASVDIRLHLTGSPSRETDYLLVYASAPRGGFLASFASASELGSDTAMCALSS